MTHIKHKVFAYITNRQRLLLFRHVYYPEAGESPEEGVLREAFEETGLTELTIDCLLGEQVRSNFVSYLEQIMRKKRGTTLPHRIVDNYTH